MPVASPYAVFRAADLAWSPAAPHPCEQPRPTPRPPMATRPAALPATRAPRPRKRLAPAGVVQGELFSPQGLRAGQP